MGSSGVWTRGIGVGERKVLSPVDSALRMKQKDYHECKASLGYIVRHGQK